MTITAPHEPGDDDRPTRRKRPPHAAADSPGPLPRRIQKSESEIKADADYLIAEAIRSCREIGDARGASADRGDS